MSFLHRRAASVVAAVTLILSAAACGADSDASEQAAGGTGSSEALAEAKKVIDSISVAKPIELDPLSTTPPSDYKVGTVTCNINACYPGELERAAESLGWDVVEETYDLAKGPSDFVAAVRRALQEKPDALSILFVYPPETIKAEIDQAIADGVVLIDVGSSVDGPAEGFIGCVYCNPALAHYGENMAQWAVVDDNGANSGFAVIGDKTIAAHQQSGKATTEELERLAPDAKVTQVNVGFAKTPQANAQTVITAIQRDPDIKYLLFQTPDLLGGMSQALSAAGLSDAVEVVAPGPTTAKELMAVQQGFPDIWISTGAGAYYWDVVDILARNLVGDDFTAMPVPPTGLVTADNASPDLLTPPDYEATYKKAWGVE